MTVGTAFSRSHVQADTRVCEEGGYSKMKKKRVRRSAALVTASANKNKRPGPQGIRFPAHNTAHTVTSSDGRVSSCHLTRAAGLLRQSLVLVSGLSEAAAAGIQPAFHTASLSVSLLSLCSILVVLGHRFPCSSSTATAVQTHSHCSCDTRTQARRRGPCRHLLRQKEREKERSQAALRRTQLTSLAKRVSERGSDSQARRHSLNN